MARPSQRVYLLAFIDGLLLYHNNVSIDNCLLPVRASDSTNINSRT